VSISNAEKILRKQLEKLNKGLQRIELRAYVDQLPKTIKQRTRQGKGLDDDNDIIKLPPIKKSTIKSREYAQRRGDLDERTKPKKSNLTMTGQLVDSLFARQIRNDTVRLSLNDSRNDGKGNNKIKKYQEDSGRKFFGAANEELKKLNERIEKQITRLIKNIFG
jgi:hypothetical protein